MSLESLLLCFSSLWLSDHVCREGTTLPGFSPCCCHSTVESQQVTWVKMGQEGHRDLVSCVKGFVCAGYLQERNI